MLAMSSVFGMLPMSSVRNLVKLFIQLGTVLLIGQAKILSYLLQCDFQFRNCFGLVKCFYLQL